MSSFMIGEELTQDLSALREQAKQIIMQNLVAQAEQDGVPPTMRAMYVMKTQEARAVAEGGSSSFIEREAELRGVEAKDLANRILTSAKQMEELELYRTKLNLEVDGCATAESLFSVMAQLGWELKV